MNISILLRARWSKSRFFFLLAGAMLHTGAVAQVWEGGAGNSDFTNGANWAGGTAPPIVFSTIEIDNNNAALLEEAEVLGGFFPPNMNVGNTASGALLTIGSGGVLELGVRVRIGGETSTAGHGTLIVTDGGRMTLTGLTGTSDSFRVGDLGTGILTLAKGGELHLGAGRLNLAYGAVGTGTLNIGAAAGEDAVAAGTLTAGNVWFGAGDGRVVFNHTDTNYAFGAAFISGSSNAGAIDFLAGTTILTGSSTQFSGIATVSGGATLAFDGDRSFGDGNAQVNVGQTSAGTLATSGDMSSGRSLVTLTLNGTLSLYEHAVLHMGLGQAAAEGSTDYGDGDLIIVNGDLVLGGTLNISNLGGLGDGTYQLFSYTGEASYFGDGMTVNFLTGDYSGTVDYDNDLGIAWLTIGVDLGTILYWGGGDGDWNNSTTSWTNAGGSASGAWADGEGAAVFRHDPDEGLGGPGVITLTENIHFTSLDFTSNGFSIEADGGDLVAVRTEDGGSTAVLRASGSVTASIHANISDGADVMNISKTGGGTIILTGQNNYRGSTTVSAGTLQVGAGGSTGNLPGNVLLDGSGTTLAFNRSDGHTYAGNISGSGTLRQIGSGTLVLTNANATRSGQTFVESGRLELQGDGGLGSGAVTLSSGATLALYRTGDWSFANALNGNGTLEQRGGGVLTLSGNLSGFGGSLAAIQGRINIGAGSTFSGSVTVNDALVVNGTVGGAVNVSNGGVVSGTGSIGSLSVGDGGTVAPGNSIGTLTVTSTASFAPGSTYEVEADNNGAADRINVSGALNITGGMVQVKASPDASASWSPSTAYTILQHGANSRQGEFEGVETDLAFLDPSLEYGTGVVRLHLERNNIAFADVALTANQRQAAAALEALGYGHDAAGPVVPLHDAVVAGTSTDARAAFDAVSGELHASLAGMMLDDSRLVRDALLGRAAMYAGRGGATSVWARAMSHSGDAEGDGVSDFERNVNGLLVGADHALGDGYGYGWTAGHHRSGDADITTLRSAGEVKSTHIGAYLGARAEGLGLRAGASYSWHEVDTRRTIDFAGFNEYLVADYKARGVQLFAEADYEIEVAGQLIAPFVNLAWASVDVEGWDEAEFHFAVGSTASLRSQSQKHDATFATLGARGELELGERFELQGMLGYRRTLSGDEPTLRVGFSDGNQAFTVQGVPLARDAFVADIGLALRIGQNMRIGAAYNGLIGSDARDHSVEARISIALQ